MIPLKPLALFLASALLSGRSQAQLTMTGAGATFPYPIYARWFDEYAKVDPSVRFNYQSIGSGGGQKQIIAQTVDFGATDGPMTDGNLAKAPGRILHIPTVAGAVALTYNLPDNPVLKLDGPTVANIFLGTVTKWNDPAIASQNPGLKLPGSDIIVVHRTDGSGTTDIFTDYLTKISPGWKARIGSNTAVKWPTGLGAKGNEGVTGQIQQVPGTFGYVELIYAVQNKMPVAQLKNAAGNYVCPSADSVTAALASAQIPDDFRFSITNPPGADSYPISAVTWLLVYQHQGSPDKGKKMVEFLNWALTTGQDMAKTLDYAPLPPSLRDRVLKLVTEIQVGG